MPTTALDTSAKNTTVNNSTAANAGAQLPPPASAPASPAASDSAPASRSAEHAHPATPISPALLAAPGGPGAFIGPVRSAVEGRAVDRQRRLKTQAMLAGRRAIPKAGIIAVPVVKAEQKASFSLTSPGFEAAPAELALSKDMATHLRFVDGGIINQLELGLANVSVRQAWDSAALTLLDTQKDHDRVVFRVRDASIALGKTGLRGYEVDGPSSRIPAVSWLAHPQTFRVINQHFHSVLKPKLGLIYLTRDNRELFVLDAAPHAAADKLPDAAIMSYSLGFPLLLHPGGAKRH